MKQNKRPGAQVRQIKLWVFAATMLLFSVIGFLWFLRPAVSTVEKRNLTPFPTFTWARLWDGSYFSDLDTWYADTYPLREGMIRANQSLQAHYGLRENQIVGETMTADAIPDPADAAPAPTASAAPTSTPAPTPTPDGTVRDLGEMQGNIYITNNSGYGLYYFSQSGADAYVSAMNQVYANVKDKVNLYVMIAPISASVMLDEAVLTDLGGSNEGDAISYVYSRLDPGIHTVSVYDNLRAHNSEYLYFHTDHHWTQLGAYYAYEMFCKEKGVTPHKPEEFETLELPGFLGTFYSSSDQSPALAANPDTVTAYIPKGTNDMTMTTADGQIVDWKIINDVSDYPQSEYYAVFAGGDQPYSYAHNPQITDGSAVLLVKDSYGNAFLPWLVDHYEHIYWIDCRYTTNTISQMVEDHGVQDVIYECSIYNGTSDLMLDYYTAIGQ